MIQVIRKNISIEEINEDDLFEYICSDYYNAHVDDPDWLEDLCVSSDDPMWYLS